jgi:NAD-dependent dihydropyrimidine dehydrogenase PreA subunit
MGHLISGKSHLVPLIDRLNRYPVGLVDHQTLREILALLFSEEEALIAARFPLTEATLDELAIATGVPADQLQPQLEAMADKGLVMDLPCGDTTYWLLMPGLIGFFEFTFMKRRSDLPLAELARLMQEYLHEIRPGQAEEFFGTRTQLTRALPSADRIPVNSQVTPWEDARRIVEAADFGAAGLCFCRHRKEHLGESCAKGAPVEGLCIALGEGARFLVRRGFMQHKTTAELLGILETARGLNLTHVTDNIREQPSFICNCCSCCCELMTGVQEGFVDGIAKAPFLAVVDAGRCSKCGQCLDACNVRGIRLEPGAASAGIDERRCLGCGACLASCPQDALRLVARPVSKPPRTRADMFLRILREKGRLLPFVTATVKSGLSRLAGR